MQDEPMIYVVRMVKEDDTEINLLSGPTFKKDYAIECCSKCNVAAFVETFYKLMPNVPGKIIYSNKPLQERNAYLYQMQYNENGESIQ